MLMLLLVKKEKVNFSGNSYLFYGNYMKVFVVFSDTPLSKYRHNSCAGESEHSTFDIQLLSYLV
jgi:hypothetical protein